MNLGSWLASAYQKMSPLIQNETTSQNSPRLDIQVLSAHVMNQNRAWVLTHPEYDLLPQQKTTLDDLLNIYLAGEPLPYILGKWEFFGLSLMVSPAVLIPRPETEILVEEAIEWLVKKKQNQPLDQNLWAADIGTGSGCIAISLAVHFPEIQIVAGDISWDALAIARTNIKQWNLRNQIQLFQGNLLSPLAKHFDIICANLPYIPTEILTGLDVTKHEPYTSLNGGADGLDLIRAILLDAPRCVSPGGLILLEIETNQTDQVLSLAHDLIKTISSKIVQTDKSRINIISDLSGRPRVLRIET